MVGIAFNNEKGLGIVIVKITAKLCCHLYKTAYPSGLVA